VKSQASDREMHDILNWMHDYDSEEELNDEDDEDEEEGDEKEGHQAGSQKEVEEMYIHSPREPRGGVRSSSAHTIFLSGFIVWRRRRRSPRPSRACSRSPPPSSKRHARTLRYAFLNFAIPCQLIDSSLVAWRSSTCDRSRRRRRCASSWPRATRNGEQPE
jgi:hypothetical protein